MFDPDGPPTESHAMIRVSLCHSADYVNALISEHDPWDTSTPPQIQAIKVMLTPPTTCILKPTADLLFPHHHPMLSALITSSPGYSSNLLTGSASALGPRSPVGAQNL